MSEDICGYEGTTTGQPCQHPAGSCPVPSHSDDDAENPQGRDFSLDESDHDDILEAAEMGKSETGCARAAGVSWPELDRYLDAHPSFRSAFRRARAEGESEWIDEGRGDDGDASFAKFMLASSYEYKTTEKKEVTGEDGGPVEINLTETVVETGYDE
jgi:hypothetical protein